MKVSETPPQPRPVYEFGDFVLDRHQLRRRDGTRVSLTSRVFETLRFLVEHHDVLLNKERIMEAVWPGSIVEENNLAQAISKLRQVLGEKAGADEFIVTVPGRGYRFVAPVRKFGESAPLPAVASEKPATSVSVPRRWPGAIVLLGVLLLGALAFVWWEYWRPGRIVLPNDLSSVPEKSIAVLPFQNLSDDQQNAYFASAVQEEILSELAQIADLKVISRTSANSYAANDPRNAREIGRQLGVAHLLEGSVERLGDRIRIHAQLIDTRTDTHLWAQTYERESSDSFAIQSDIANAIAHQLQAKISPAEKTAMAQPMTTNAEASRLQAQVKALLDQIEPSPDAVGAIRLLDEAVRRDPQAVAAYCLLAKIHLELYVTGYDHSEARRELANAAVQKAVRLQPDAGRVHLAQAQYAYLGFSDYDRARAELELARRALPNDPEVYLLNGKLDRRQGRWSEATRNFERAVELDPRNSEVLCHAAACYGFLRRYPEAIRLFERAMAIAPRHYIGFPRAEQIFLSRADLGDLHEQVSAVLADGPAIDASLADSIFLCAQLERDNAAMARSLEFIPTGGMNADFGAPREWFAGVVARDRGDEMTAQASFAAARDIAAKEVHDQPEHAAAWGLLGRIDAALGRKEEALAEGRRACQLQPTSKHALDGAALLKNLAVIFAQTGEKDLALEYLTSLAQMPAGVHYGELKLHPDWDPLRGDPRFEKIVAALAPR